MGLESFLVIRDASFLSVMASIYATATTSVLVRSKLCVCIRRAARATPTYALKVIARREGLGLLDERRRVLPACLRDGSLGELGQRERDQPLVLLDAGLVLQQALQERDGLLESRERHQVLALEVEVVSHVVGRVVALSQEWQHFILVDDVALARQARQEVYSHKRTLARTSRIWRDCSCASTSRAFEARRSMISMLVHIIIHEYK